MPTTKKAAKRKGGRGAKSKLSGGRVSASSARDGGPVPPYGPPIREAIARGNVNEMRKLAVVTRKWLRDVKAALTRLEKAIDKMS